MVRKAMEKRFGDESDPLLVSVRSGAAFSMPGMMETVLNVGLNDVTVHALATLTGDARFLGLVPPACSDVRSDGHGCRRGPFRPST